MKPSWGDAPEWANWLAMDDDGAWFWYEERPIIGLSIHKKTTGRSRRHKFGESAWKFSQEQRPNCSRKD